jgi:Protein of unknown function (DUF1517)
VPLLTVPSVAACAETVLALLRHPEYCQYGAASTKGVRGLDAAEDRFNEVIGASALGNSTAFLSKRTPPDAHCTGLHGVLCFACRVLKPGLMRDT